MKCFFSLILILQLSLIAEDWQTKYEKSGYLETSSYEQTIDFCSRLAQTSPFVQYSNFGKTSRGFDLPLLIVDKDGQFTPLMGASRNKAILLVQAGIHPGEIDGKDAGLTLIRDIIINNYHSEWLDNVTILFIPIFNVDGFRRFGPYNRINQNGPKEMGWRVTAQNLNLNRDYVKAESPEMKAWLKLYNQWLPDFFVDCHATDGADYQYPATYGLELHGNLEKNLSAWLADSYLPHLEKKLAKVYMPIFPYIAFREWHDPESGLKDGAAGPRYSQGYCAVQNRPGLLIETHMLKDYKTRVTVTRKMIEETLNILNKEYRQLIQLNQSADDYTASAEFRKNDFALSYEMGPDSTLVEFLGYEYRKIPSDLSGGNWFIYDNTKPKKFKLPLFDNVIPEISAKLPEAYIIPPEWKQLISILKLHGVKTTVLQSEFEIPVKTYKFSNPRWESEPYEGRHPLKTDMAEISLIKIYPAGSVLVDMNQRTARIIAHLLEPAAEDSWLSWGYMDAIFEQKEYAESYVMEKLAREMLTEDAELKKEFYNMIQSDESFRNDPRAILNWFYSKTPYWDMAKDIYPVGRIFDRNSIEKIKK